jgi:uncharacterized protein (TIRG00374 family)
MKNIISSLVKIVVAIVIIYLLLRKMNLADTWGLLKRADLVWIFLSLSSFFLFVVISVIRWKVLLDARGLTFSSGYLLRVYFVSLFFNNLLPTAIGGDVMRVFYTRNPDLSGALAVCFFDRVIGFIGLFFFALLATLASLLFWLRGFPYGREAILLNLFGFLLLSGFTYALISEKTFNLFRRFWLKLKFFSLGKRLDSFFGKLPGFSSNPKALVSSFTLSLVVQLLLSLVWYFGGLAIKRPLSPFYYFLYIPLINVLTMVPITFGGLGVREGSFVYLFGKVGLRKEEAMGISLIFLLMNYLHSLIGGLIFIGIKRGGKDA